MKYLSRLLFAVVFAAMMSVGFSGVFARGDDAGGASLAHRFFFELQRAEALHQRVDEVAQSLEIKKIAIADLIAGRMTVREATEQFRAADEMIEDGNNGLVATYHRPRTEEGLRRQLLVWVEAALTTYENPRQIDEILDRLKDQMGEPFSLPVEISAEDLLTE